jgi:thioredoxin reductase
MGGEPPFTEGGRALSEMAEAQCGIAESWARNDLWGLCDDQPAQQETSMPGVFAAGDYRRTDQAATAVGAGASAGRTLWQ